MLNETFSVIFKHRGWAYFTSTVMFLSTAIIGHKNPLKLKSCSSPLTIVATLDKWTRKPEKKESLSFQVLFALREIVVGTSCCSSAITSEGGHQTTSSLEI